MDPVTDGLIITKSPDVDLGIKHVTLSDGESIIARVWYNAVDKEYNLENPVFPNLTQNPENGKMAVSLLPIRPYVELRQPRMTLKDIHVVYTLPVRKDMEKLYRQMTSDIQVADASDLNSILSQK
jgi:hypothetical protein